MLSADTTRNPLIPTEWEITAQVVGLIGVGLMIWAIIAVLRARNLTTSIRLALVLAAVLVPFLGPVLALLGARSLLPSQNRTRRDVRELETTSPAAK
ncbi:hypothetical protein [Nesterenkonia massiliensis]|uniref:hypothetical protein n=1 Tax=Nesterenkonia massiliensis TaxID=1232429 RepID=UPI0005C92FE2|nr:hypothetical protein [Nesterenkonia massiliensis]